MTSTIHALLGTTLLAFGVHAAAQVTYYEGEHFQGRSATATARTTNLERSGYRERASSIVVSGSARWQACDDTRLSGNCMVLRPGRYADPQAMGLQERVSSLRPLAAREHVAESDYAPLPQVAQDFHRRRNERLYDADVTSSHAVLGTPGQRCWMESSQVPQPAPAGRTDNLNLPGAAVGALIGGILGHQVGGGTGKQIATVGGALGGAALGSQYGRADAPAPQAVAQEVRHCDSNPVQAVPAYWDVTYDFRGQQHRMQMSSAPGRTVTVNANGEPRI
ncbi:glycine zipper 2TM domain-containing protein [Ramlibacter ginsenosidimutans]|uniref:Glycine zipper 2TM domain-containing protein n=1 Tax=Ramlibacter ginsenosidimutans TaxID=502333 RepID=A0A934WNB6_9BURK|nr:beta/gamma crystallin-related protein [Ramlibacter ginsenosidimutans]MBK6007383.1 glycine zipper 2TM domain-containing protein [Ramlibacter ginsenosidimutans]